jgi:hypothetical protein
MDKTVFPSFCIVVETKGVPDQHETLGLLSFAAPGPRSF